MNKDTLDKAKSLDAAIDNLESIIKYLSEEGYNRMRNELLGFSLTCACENKREIRNDLISLFQKILDDTKYELEML